MKEKDIYYCQNKKVYEFHNSLMGAFEESVEKYSNQTALIYKEKELTYQQFNEKVNQYAAYLRTKGVGKETPVGIHMYRSVEMMIAIYAVLKAGGAYVPLDPDYPVDRLCFISDDLGLNIILNNVGEINRKLAKNRMVLSIEQLAEEVKVYSTENVPQENLHHNMAYIIFTSGSTGIPKGAVIEHKSVLNRIYWMQDYLKLAQGERVLQKTPISFDVSVWELFWPLMYGATLVIAKPGGHKEPSYLVDVIRKHGITTIHFVPSMLQAFLMFQDSAKCTTLERVVCSGEELEEHHALRFFEMLPDSRLYNLYGPTEATVDVTYYEIKKERIPRRIPIGKAVSNCELYILDQDLNPVPFGEEGDLYIGGICLCRGYFNRPELNEERFIKNPFSREEGSRLYKTGDLAKYREDGEILYIGRSDFQVKLRGLRIELGEIESAIRKTGQVKDVAVTVFQDKELNDSQLIAYVISEEKSQGSDEDKNRVEEWKAVFDDTYAGGSEEESAVDSDYSGWMSSYTGKRIPDKDMEKWVLSTVERIEELQNKRILELGCGTGLLLYKLAPHVERFVGIDLSDVAVENLRTDIRDRGEAWSHVSIYQGAADDLAVLEGETFDCIVINSVIQLFPSIEYLYQVIKNALNVLEDEGKIFIGDVRDLKFLELFHASVESYKAQGTLSIEELKNRIADTIKNDKELLVSQKFFQNISAQLQDITAVEIMTKQFDIVNELSKFRYDVVLYKNKTVTTTKEQLIFNYQKQAYTLEEVNNLIVKNPDACIKFVNVPNSILKEEQSICRFLEGQEEQKENNNTSYLPMDFYQLGATCRRRCLVNMKNVNFMEVVYCRKQELYSTMESEPNLKLDELGIFATNPTKNGNEEQIIQAIRSQIRKTLPDYMIPAKFIFMDVFPLLPNGKLNRKELPIPEMKEKRSTAAYMEPKTMFEKDACTIWSKLLKVERVGIKDSFFELGGHSLLAIKFFNIISEKYNKQISLSRFMNNPTIQGLSMLFEEKNTADIKVEYEKAVPDSEHVYEPFALSDMQQAYYVGRSNEIMYGGVSTHVYTEFNFVDLDHKKFEEAINELIKRHGMLRCIINEDSTQQILPSVPYYQVATEDMNGKSFEECETFVEDVRNQMFYREYDLSQYPLFEVRMTKTDSCHTRIHICYDNIILDGASQGIMIEEMLHLYREGLESLKPIEFSFRDYFLAEQRFRQGERYKQAMAYWKKRCETIPEGPKLPICSVEEDGRNRRVKRKEAILDAIAWSRLKEISKEYEITPSNLLISAFSEVIERWSSTKHFCLNLPTFNRFPFHKDVENMIGEFGSIYLLEVNRTLGHNFLEKTQELQKQFWKDMDYNIVTGVDVLRELAVYQEDIIMPVVFTSLLTHDKRRSFLHEEVETVYWRSQSSQVWLDAVVSEDKDTLCIDWDYVDGIFEENMIMDMFEAYIKLLNDLAKDEHLWRQNNLDVLPINQKEKRIQYNNTQERISECYLHQLFYHSVEKYPERIACINGDEQLTYLEIYQYAIGLSEQLTKYQVKPNELVAMILPKGWRQVAAALGVMFAGAAYLPLDVKWPEARLNELLIDANVNVVITDEINKELIKRTKNIIELPTMTPNIPMRSWKAKQELDDLAYVIYTSGSTGKPKGVAISHKAANNTILDINQKFGITKQDRAIGLSEMNFDLSVYDVFGMLAVGGTIVIPTENEKNNVLAWQDLILRHQITVWNTVPSLMDLFFSECQKKEQCFRTLHTILLSGDWIPVAIPDKIRALNQNIQISSLGGATEASIWSIYYPIERNMLNQRSVPYGHPLANQTFYVLDEELRDCPEYVTGELYIGGKGIAVGYWNDTEKTKEKFIIHPVTKERLYATGDLGRYYEPFDNQQIEIEFVGRKDFQVKLNGYRIELGEIEAVLQRLEGIKNCIVDIKENEQKCKVIAAFYLSDEELDKDFIVTYLEQNIPHYMIPSYYIRLSELPLTDNGKVNRKALLLPKNKVQIEETGYQFKDNELVKFVLRTCQELLNVPELKLSDDFFVCGGNSITIMRFMTRIQNEYHVSLKLREFFYQPRFSYWVELIEEKIKNTNTQEVKNEVKIRRTEIPLTFAQEGMLLNEIIYKKGLNVLNASLKITGNLDIERLENAIKQVITRHPILNTRIVESHKYEFVQNIMEDCSDVLLVIPFEEDIDFLPEYFIEKAEWKFELLSERLYDFELLCLGNKEYLFVITFHHIISDEVTFEIVIREVIQAYQGNLPEEKEWGFVDYAYEQRKTFHQKERECCLRYWEEKVSHMELKDYLREDFTEEDKAGVYCDLNISKENLKQLAAICTTCNTTLFNGMLAVYTIAYAKLLQSSYVTIGIPVSDRGKLEQEDVCGLFINISVLCMEINKGDNFVQTLKNVQTELLMLIENSILPFDEVVRELKLERKYLEVPFNVNMNVLAAKQVETIIGDTHFAPFQFTKHLVGHNMGILLEEEEGRVSFTYRKSVQDNFVQEFIVNIEQVLKQVIQNPEEVLENIFER